MLEDGKGVGAAFNGPDNSYMGMQEATIMSGSVKDVDLDAHTCVVMVSDKLYRDVCIPVMNYYPGNGDDAASTGLYCTPAINTYVVFMQALNGKRFLLNSYIVGPRKDRVAQIRETPDSDQWIITTRAGDKITISENKSSPTITITSRKNVVSRVENKTDSGILTVAESKLESPSAIQTFTVAGGDGSELVTRKQVQEAVDSLMAIIKSHNHPVSGVVATPTLSVSSTPKVIGVAGLQTVNAENAGSITAVTVPDEAASNPEVKAAVTSADAAAASLAAMMGPMDTAKEAISAAAETLDAAKALLKPLQTAVEAAQTAYDSAPEPVSKAAALAALEAAKVVQSAAAAPVNTAATALVGLQEVVDSAQQVVIEKTQEALAAKEAVESAIATATSTVTSTVTSVTSI